MCKNNINNTTCRAFPESIPYGILINEVGHTKPYEGDHGIVYESVCDDELDIDDEDDDDA